MAQPSLPPGNIQNMPSAQAKGILRPIRQQAGMKHTIDLQSVQIVIDATDHPNESTAEYALSVIRYLSDKQPFAAALVKQASDHMRPMLSRSAYEAMCGAQDFGALYPTIEKGVCCPDIDLARAALLPILMQGQAHNFVDPLLEQAVILGIDHNDDRVAMNAVTIISFVTLASNKQPFIPALQRCAVNPNLRIARGQAAYQLGNMNNVVPSSFTSSSASRASGAGVPLAANALIKNVRLDFNIEANGGGSALHPNDAMRALCGVFDQAVKDGIVAVKAKVFCAPVGTLEQNEIIDVNFPENDQEDILRLLARGVSPEFDLQTRGSGVYTLTLKERLSL